MIHFDSPYLTVHWNEEGQFVEMEWKKNAEGDDFRTGLNAGLNLVIEKKAFKWLADLRNLGVVAKEDRIWSNEDWFPRAFAAHIQYMAIVVPQSVFGKLSVNEIMQKVEYKELTVFYLEDIDEARKWLRSQ